MRKRGAATGIGPIRLGVLLAAAAALALGLAACGGDDEEIASEERPPSPIEVTASIKDRAVEVSPADVGAGLANITISNQSDDPAAFTLSGPTDVATAEIPPGATANLKAELVEGSYEASAGEDAESRPGELEVGPERESAQNELLLP